MVFENWKKKKNALFIISKFDNKISYNELLPYEEAPLVVRII